MVSLTEDMILSRARASNLQAVKNFNCWGMHVDNVASLKLIPNVEVINFSGNNIKTLDGIQECPNLKELYLRKNQISNISEIRHLQDLKELRLLWMSGNPFCEQISNEEYRMRILKVLPQLTKLDNIVVTPEELQQAIDSGYDGGSTNHHSTSNGDRALLEAPLSLEETNKLRAQLGFRPLPSHGRPRSSKSSKSNKSSSSTTSSKSSNLLTATLALIEELDQESLAVVRDAIEAKLDVNTEHSSMSSNASVEEEILEQIEVPEDVAEEPKGGMVSAMKEKFKNMLEHA